MSACDDGFRPGWFEEDWHTDYRLDLIQPLANYGFDCENFRYRRSTKWRDSYQVQCSPDGSEWMSFLVWPRDGRVRRQ